MRRRLAARSSASITECVLSTLLAPIFMLSHTGSCSASCSAAATRWGPQLRGGGGIGLWQSMRAFAPHTLVAVVAGLAAWYWTPADFWWYMPLLVGGLLAILLCWVTGSPALGALAGGAVLFVIRSETTGVPIVDRFESLVAAPLPTL